MSLFKVFALFVILLSITHSGKAIASQPKGSSPPVQYIQPNDLTPGTFAGRSVSLDVTTAVISAQGRNNGQGGAYVYIHSETAPNWTHQATLIPSDSMPGDNAGIGENSVAMSINTAAIGNPLHQSGQGSVAIFLRSGVNWTEQRVIAGPGGNIKFFGQAVALDTNIIAIGAQNTSTNQGVVYIYTRSTGIWTLTTTLTPTDPMNGDLFGTALAIRNTRVVVGAPGNTNGRGAFYVFERISGVWNQTARVGASDGVFGDNFGYSISIDGATIVSGAPNRTNSGASAGAAYVYVLSGGWVQQARFDGGNLPGSKFGYSVTISVDWAIVAQPFNDATGAKVFVYQRSGSVWSYFTTLTQNVSNQVIRPALFGVLMMVGLPNASLGAGEITSYQFFTPSWVAQTTVIGQDAMSGSKFGGVTTVNGNLAAWGAPGSNFGQGAVYVYSFNGSSWALQQKIISNDPQNYNNFGASVVMSRGELLAIGETGRDGTGTVAIYTLVGSVWTFVARVKGNDLSPNDEFGTSLALYGGDLVNDDVLVAGTQHQNSFRGAAYVFKNASGTWTQTQKLTASDAAPNMYFSSGTQGIDINSEFIVIGAPGRNSSAGAVYTFRNNSGIYTQESILVPASATAGARYGASVTINLPVSSLLMASDSSTVGNTVWFENIVATSTWFESQTISFGDSVLARGVGSVSIDGNRMIMTRNDPTNGGLFGYYNPVVWFGQTRFDPAPRFTFEQSALSGTTITTGNRDYGDSRGIGVVFNFVQTGARPDSVGIYDPGTGTFALDNDKLDGDPDITFTFGPAGCQCFPVMGDWNSDGIDTVALYYQASGVFQLRNSNTTGNPDAALVLGNPNDQPIAGHWTADMTTDGLGVFRPSNGILYLKKTLTTGFADYFAILGNPGDIGVAGDWDGDGLDTVGVFRPFNSTFYISNNTAPSGIVYGDATIAMGVSTDLPVTGDWGGVGRSGIGIYRPGTQVFHLKNVAVPGSVDRSTYFQNSGTIPVSGRWYAPIQSPPPNRSYSRVPGIIVDGTFTSITPNGNAD